jgi:hypothetical protein
LEGLAKYFLTKSLFLLIILKSKLYEGSANMPNKKKLLTSEGLKELESELHILKSKSRFEVAVKIKEARSFGDLSENAEYDEAKNDQADIERRILNIESILRDGEVIDKNIIEDIYIEYRTAKSGYVIPDVLIKFKEKHIKYG